MMTFMAQDTFIISVSYTHLDVYKRQEQESRDVHTLSYIRNKLLASKLVLSYPLFGGNLSLGGEYTDCLLYTSFFGSY